jgi:hypothetical protein
MRNPHLLPFSPIFRQILPTLHPSSRSLYLRTARNCSALSIWHLELVRIRQQSSITAFPVMNRISISRRRFAGPVTTCLPSTIAGAGVYQALSRSSTS